MAAILRDPNPIHWDTRAAAALGFGERTINQGPLGLSYIVNMLESWSGHGSLLSLTMTFPQVVLSEDRVIAEGRVLGVLEEAGQWFAECEVWLFREGSGRVLEGRARVRLPN